MFDAAQVMPRLFLGGVPAKGSALADNGLDVLVLVDDTDASGFDVDVLAVSADDVDVASLEVSLCIEEGKNVLICGSKGSRDLAVATMVRLGLDAAYARRFVDSARPEA